MPHELHARCPQGSRFGLSSWRGPSRALTPTSQVTSPPDLPMVQPARLSAHGSLFVASASGPISLVLPSDPPLLLPAVQVQELATPLACLLFLLSFVVTRPPSACTPRPHPILPPGHGAWGPVLAIVSCFPGAPQAGWSETRGSHVSNSGGQKSRCLQGRAPS